MSERKEFFEEQLRKRILEHEFEFQESDWQGMETLLDSPSSIPVPAPLPKRFFFKRNVLFLMIILFCSIVGAYWFNATPTENTSNNKHDLNTKIEIKAKKEIFDTTNVVKMVSLKKEQPVFSKKEGSLMNEKSIKDENLNQTVLEKNPLIATNETNSPINEITDNKIEEAQNKKSIDDNTVNKAIETTKNGVALLENKKNLGLNLSPKEKNDTLYLLPNKAVCCNVLSNNKNRFSVFLGSEITGFKPSTLGVEYSYMLTKILGVGTSIQVQRQNKFYSGALDSNYIQKMNVALDVNLDFALLNTPRHFFKVGFGVGLHHVEHYEKRIDAQQQTTVFFYNENVRDIQLNAQYQYNITSRWHIGARYGLTGGGDGFEYLGVTTGIRW